MAKLASMDWRPDARKLREFGFLLCALNAFGAVMDARRVWLFAACGLVAVLLALVAPMRLRFLFVGLSALTFPLGWLVSHLTLAVIFFCVITPIAFVLRLTGRDVLRIKRPRSAQTGWHPISPRGHASSYLSQY